MAIDIKEPLQVGTEINHPEYGSGTITFVGDDYIGVQLVDGRRGLLKKDLISSRLEADDMPDALPALQLTWPDNTFIWEPEDQPHYLGSHWEPFYEEATDLYQRLPEIIPQSSVHEGFSSNHPAPREIPEEWANGAHLYWPGHYSGLVITLLIEKHQNRAASIYPYICTGVEVSIEIQRVFVWHSGVEAQIEGKWGDALVTFFDASFLSDRAWYEAGESYQFILSGIAYEAKPAELNELQVKLPSDVIEGLRAVAEEQGDEALAIHDLETLQLKGAAMFSCIPEWDRDDYWFRGTVRKVSSFDDWLGQSGWQVRVTVMRFDDKDADLDIFITQRIWSGSKPPKTGQDIEGSLWLQGHLWYAHAWKP